MLYVATYRCTKTIENQGTAGMVSQRTFDTETEKEAVIQAFAAPPSNWELVDVVNYHAACIIDNGNTTKYCDGKPSMKRPDYVTQAS